MILLFDRDVLKNTGGVVVYRDIFNEAVE